MNSIYKLKTPDFKTFVVLPGEDKTQMVSAWAEKVQFFKTQMPEWANPDACFGFRECKWSQLAVCERQ